MTVELIAYTQMPGKPGNPMAVVEQAASVCYDSRPTENYRIAKSCGRHPKLKEVYQK